MLGYWQDNKLIFEFVSDGERRVLANLVNGLVGLHKAELDFRSPRCEDTEFGDEQSVGLEIE